MSIAVVGSGGKTTLIKKLAARYRSQGRTVFVTTTTHMFIEEDTLLTDDADTIIGALRETGYAMAGIPVARFHIVDDYEATRTERKSKRCPKKPFRPSAPGRMWCWWKPTDRSSFR